MISEGHTIEYIKTREQIIRDFYREWKEKNRPSDKGYHPFYEFPDDPTKICSFS